MSHVCERENVCVGERAIKIARGRERERGERKRVRLLYDLF